VSFDLHDQLSQEYNGAELWGYRRVRCGQLTAAPAPQRMGAPGSKLKNQPVIDLGKLWAQKPKSLSVLPEDLDWFDSDTAQAYEEFADETSTAQVHPLQFTNSMAMLAQQKGARLIMGKVEHINCCGVDDVAENAAPLASSDDLTGKRVVSVTYEDKATSEKHILEATTVILAAGPWSPTLHPKIRMQPLRAHSVTMKLQRPLSAYCLFSDIRVAAGAKPVSLEIYPRPNNEVYICSQGDLNVPLPAPGSLVEVSVDSCQNLVDAATSVSRELRNGQVTGRRACYLPMLDTKAGTDPLVGRTELSGLVLATGHSCWGIAHAPGTGKAVSELVFDGHISCVDAVNLDPRVIH